MTAELERGRAARGDPSLSGLLNLFDFERAVEAALEPMAWRYFQAGAGDERTLRQNRAAFERCPGATSPGFGR